MGMSFYLICRAQAPCSRQALILAAVQLAVNFVWTLLFFNLRAFFGAFLWILRFARISRAAAYLQIPYPLRVMFAARLNFMVFFLTRA